MEAMTEAVRGELHRTITSAASGDEVAFGQIVRAHHDDMRRVCRFITRDDGLADDAVQLAWTIAWRKLHTLRDAARLRPWLISVAANEAKRLAKRRRRRLEVELPSAGIDRPGGIDPATGIDRVDLRRAMAGLHPDDRALLAMRYVAGFTAVELSSAIGLSPPGTRARLARLLKRLREELEHG
jgi:RNA polymerase sigma-70 factor (ECF subfamily)